MFSKINFEKLELIFQEYSYFLLSPVFEAIIIQALIAISTGIKSAFIFRSAYIVLRAPKKEINVIIIFIVKF